MCKVYIKKLNKDININLNNINKKRAEYLSKLKGNSQLISYCSWMYLKEIALTNYNVDIDKLNLLYNDYKKPYFENNPFFFNISHSNDLIAIAISNTDVGVDIQLIKDNPYLSKLAKKINITNDTIEIIKRFSSLEAYYKKIGTGLYPSQLNNNISITHQQIISVDNNDYVLSLSCDEDFTIVHI